MSEYREEISHKGEKVRGGLYHLAQHRHLIIEDQGDKYHVIFPIHLNNLHDVCQDTGHAQFWVKKDYCKITKYYDIELTDDMEIYEWCRMIGIEVPSWYKVKIYSHKEVNWETIPTEKKLVPRRS